MEQGAQPVEQRSAPVLWTSAPRAPPPWEPLQQEPQPPWELLPQRLEKDERERAVPDDVSEQPRCRT